jgi:hypothetical protein
MDGEGATSLLNSTSELAARAAATRSAKAGVPS